MAPLPGPPELWRAGPYPWSYVLARHGSRRGIRALPGGPLSLLLDYGLSGYANFWEGETLHYLGHGKRGPQTVTPDTALLLEAALRQELARVWERLRPGLWYDLGLWRVVGAERRELAGRLVFDFHLRAEPRPG